MKRRGFLQAMLAAAAAPAIVKAENLMKIVVPKQEIILPERELVRGIDGDFTVEAWINAKDVGEWKHMAVSRSVNKLSGETVTTTYVNGVAVSQKEFQKDWITVSKRPGNMITLDNHNGFQGNINDLRITQGVTRDISVRNAGLEKSPEIVSNVFRAPPAGLIDNRFAGLREMLTF